MDWIAIVEHEGHALSTAARHDFTAPVPSCPGWDVNDLLTHVAVIHHRTADLLRTRRQEPFGPDPVPPHGNVLAWYEAGLEALVDALRGIEPGADVWTPGRPTAAFWFRRMAHETFVHRIDAELATGQPSAIDPALAADAVDELLEYHVVHKRAGTAVGDGETVHLHATDAEGEWVLTLTPSGVAVEHAHAKGDVAVRGTAADLLLWITGRRPGDDLERFGDGALADRLRELATW